MPKSKVIRAEYKNRNWNGPNGTIYYYDVEFENGDRGEYGSKSIDQKNFVPGRECNYEKKPAADPKYPDKIMFVKDTPQGGYKKELDPGEQLQISKMVAMECAVHSMEFADQTSFTKDSDFQIAEYFLKWLQSKGSDKKNGTAASNALKRAVEMLAYPSMQMNGAADVLKKADKLFEWYQKQ